ELQAALPVQFLRERDVDVRDIHRGFGPPACHVVQRGAVHPVVGYGVDGFVLEGDQVVDLAAWGARRLAVLFRLAVAVAHDLPLHHDRRRGLVVGGVRGRIRLWIVVVWIVGRGIVRIGIVRVSEGGVETEARITGENRETAEVGESEEGPAVEPDKSPVEAYKAAAKSAVTYETAATEAPEVASGEMASAAEAAPSKTSTA